MICKTSMDIIDCYFCDRPDYANVPGDLDCCASAKTAKGVSGTSCLGTLEVGNFTQKHIT